MEVGLYIGMILDELELRICLTYEILEGIDRVGGRVHSSDKKHDYYDVGLYTIALG